MLLALPLHKTCVSQRQLPICRQQWAELEAVTAARTQHQFTDRESFENKTTKQLVHNFLGCKANSEPKLAMPANGQTGKRQRAKAIEVNHQRMLP